MLWKAYLQEMIFIKSSNSLHISPTWCGNFTKYMNIWHNPSSLQILYIIFWQTPGKENIKYFLNDMFMKTLIFSTFLHSTYTCIVFFYVDWIRVSAFKKKGDHQNKSHILLLVRGEVRGSRFEPNFSDLHEIVGKSTKIQYH